MPFADTWNAIQVNLRPGMTVPKWSVAGQHGQGLIRIVRVDRGTIHVGSDGAKSVQHVPREEFEAVYDVWAQYIGGTLQRQELRRSNRFTTYIIAILKWLETANDGTLP